MIKRIRMRTLLFGGIITLLFLVLISRIYYMQVVVGAEWYDMAKNRWSAAEKMVAKRGTITDRDGNVLAMDTIAYNVSVNPQAINDAEIAEEVIDGLAELLGVEKEAIRKQVTAKKEDGSFYSQRELRQGGWQIEKTVADQIIQLRDQLRTKLIEAKKSTTDTGIILDETLKRYYPRHTLASQLVGYLSLDRETMTGVEAYFNDILTGEDGYIHYLKDGQRVQLPKGEVDYKPVKNGETITLTIDSDIQHYAEEALREIVKKYSPKSATAIAVDPKTMEILAMANVPEYDPNEYWKNSGSSYNHAIRSLYEPGSTFKIMTLAAAVEEGVFNPEEMYKSGSIKVPGGTIRDHNRVGWGTISFLEGLKYSSNVAFVKLGYERLGAEKLKQYFSNFGFGQKTGISLGGELAGTINFYWPHEVASASFGQGVVQVTPLQQVVAVAAVANGGKLLQPQIVKSITDPDTKTTTVMEPKFIRQVISEETSRKVGEYLEQVVSDLEKGTGRNAYIEGYRVAGKTGTAQKVKSTTYSENKYVVSFIGYAPVDDPRIVVYIIVDEPDTPSGGGAVAAPAFREIVYKSLRKWGVAPNWKPDTNSDKKEVTVVVPDMTGFKVARAKAELNAAAMNYEIVGNGGTVLQQIPAPKMLVHPTQRVYLITEQRDKLAVPDLTGVSLRDALEITSLIGVRLVTEGQGYIVSQKLEEQNGERVLRVRLSPPAGSEEYIEYTETDDDESLESEDDPSEDSDQEEDANADQQSE